MKEIQRVNDREPPIPPAAPAVATVPIESAAEPRRVLIGNLSWGKTFRAFRHRNYRLFFSGQLISVIGTWMQQVAIGWLVYDLSNSAFTLGMVRFLTAMPVTLLTLVGGAVADRVEKRRVVIMTESSAMILAFILATLAWFHVIQIWHIVLLGVLDGITDAFDIPTRQSLVVDMVGKDDLMNAIALNSSLFNGARVFGPALAGLLIGFIGVAGCLYLNGLSYVAIVIAYLAMRLPYTPSTTARRSMWHETVEAFRYVRGHRRLRAIISLVTVVSLFGWPYTVLLPVFARDVLHLEARGYGMLMAANGLGALFGALTLASVGQTPHRRKLFFGGLFGFCGMIIVFAQSHLVWLSASALAGSGFFMIIFFATANTSVQTAVPDEMRGRVMGIYAFAFLGLTPFGSLIAGSIAKATSAAFAVSGGAVICILAGLTVIRLVPAQPTPPPAS